MTDLIEARSTINMPGLPAGRVVHVDPSIGHIAMCIENGYLVATGRRLSVPTQNARGAVRPSTSAAPEKSATGATSMKKRPKRASRAKTPPS